MLAYVPRNEIGIFSVSMNKHTINTFTFLLVFVFILVIDKILKDLEKSLALNY